MLGFLKVVGVWIGMIVSAFIGALSIVFLLLLSISPGLLFLGLVILVFKLIFFGL